MELLGLDPGVGQTHGQDRHLRIPGDPYDLLEFAGLLRTHDDPSSPVPGATHPVPREDPLEVTAQGRLGGAPLHPHLSPSRQSLPGFMTPRGSRTCLRVLKTCAPPGSSRGMARILWTPIPWWWLMVPP